MVWIAGQIDSGDTLLQADSWLAKTEVVQVSEKSSDNRSGVEKLRKLDVSSGQLGRGKPTEEIQQKLELKEHALVRTHNRSLPRRAPRCSGSSICAASAMSTATR